VTGPPAACPSPWLLYGGSNEQAGLRPDVGCGPTEAHLLSCSSSCSLTDLSRRDRRPTHRHERCWRCRLHHFTAAGGGGRAAGEGFSAAASEKEPMSCGSWMTDSGCRRKCSGNGNSSGCQRRLQHHCRTVIGCHVQGAVRACAASHMWWYLSASVQVQPSLLTSVLPRDELIFNQLGPLGTQMRTC